MRKSFCSLALIVSAAVLLGILSTGLARGELLVHYKMDENSSGMVTDYSSYHTNGILSGTDYSIQSGIIGNAVFVDEASCVTAEDVMVPQLNNTFYNFSAAQWVSASRLIGTNEVQYLMGKCGQSGQRGFFFMMNNQTSAPAGWRVQIYSSPYDGTATNFSSDPMYFLPAYEWTHLGFTFDNGVGALYINGRLYGHTMSNGESYISTNNSADFQIGQRGDDFSGTSSYGQFNGFAGGLDDTGVWNETLSAQKMALIHGLGRFAEVDLGSSEIADVLNAFLAGPGNGAMAGGYTWSYATGLTGELGAINSGAIANPDLFVSNGYAYIVLDSMGNGVKIGAVPEPSTLVMLAAGLIGLIAYAWKKRK